MKKALEYVLLLIFVLWLGLTLRESHTPLPTEAPVPAASVEEAVKEPVAAASSVEEEPTAPEPEQEISEAGGLIGAPPPKLEEKEEVVYDEAYVQALEYAVHERTNVERVREGLGILEYDEALATVGAYHSTDMATEEYFAHEDENGCDSSCRLDKADYGWRAVGENLFLMRTKYHYTVEEASAIVVQGWMGSEGHRHNLLYDNFTREGIGVVIKGDDLYVTQMFSRPR